MFKSKKILLIVVFIIISLMFISCGTGLINRAAGDVYSFVSDKVFNAEIEDDVEYRTIEVKFSPAKWTENKKGVIEEFISKDERVQFEIDGYIIERIDTKDYRHYTALKTDTTVFDTTLTFAPLKWSEKKASLSDRMFGDDRNDLIIKDGYQLHVIVNSKERIYEISKLAMIIQVRESE